MTYEYDGGDVLIDEVATGANAYTTSYEFNDDGLLQTSTRTGSGASSVSYEYDDRRHLWRVNSSTTYT